VSEPFDPGDLAVQLAVVVTGDGTEPRGPTVLLRDGEADDIVRSPVDAWIFAQTLLARSTAADTDDLPAECLRRRIASDQPDKPVAAAATRRFGLHLLEAADLDGLDVSDDVLGDLETWAVTNGVHPVTDEIGRIIDTWERSR
jgi:hypothetical protein